MSHADSYAENARIAREELAREQSRFRALRTAGHITPNPDGGWVYSNPEAKRVHGRVLVVEAELKHWVERLAMERQRERAAAVMEPDRRLPREPGEEG